MATKTEKNNIFGTLFGTLFASGIDEEDYEEVTLPKELADARKAVDEKAGEVEKGFNSAKKGGFTTKKIDPKTEEAMRAIHGKVIKKEEPDRGER